jgi:hypothetical protein
MEDQTGTLMCGLCADDAHESGLFREAVLAEGFDTGEGPTPEQARALRIAAIVKQRRTLAAELCELVAATDEEIEQAEEAMAATGSGQEGSDWQAAVAESVLFFVREQREGVRP